VEDASGRILHRNDLAFEQEDEHGRSVSRRHALFFRDGIGFRVCDLTSAGGTWILRDGRNIKVSSRVDEGIGLRDGDLVYLAQAGVQVKLKPRPKLPEQRSPPST
jgi:pSer/pThr/pTyr-binding forkhead associated (FHA) protein